MARNYQKYAVYGCSVKILPKAFFPSAVTEANIQGISAATTTDYQSATAPDLGHTLYNQVSTEM